MTSVNFCYWLQGYLEISSALIERGVAVPQLTIGQVEMIQKHLTLVFAHEIDPSQGDEKHQAKLYAIHNFKEEEAAAEELKPDDWQPHWEFSPLHGWYDPKFGKPRC